MLGFLDLILSGLNFFGLSPFLLFFCEEPSLSLPPHFSPPPDSSSSSLASLSQNAQFSLVLSPPSSGEAELTTTTSLPGVRSSRWPDGPLKRGHPMLRPRPRPAGCLQMEEKKLLQINYFPKLNADFAYLSCFSPPPLFICGRRPTDH